ncbi:uncharacterized protein LOC111012415 [Momordica charantia]|uniref:Uncharacterized protein LOC111012415 n=1 Tax=Momordica charantia TaxID=3673 RepID=A0A6J1CL22_MOMCH|nr:uncharacterized protein LOC111012415 [Momordica charantia]
MVTEDREILGGWPLGLEVMNTRLRMTQPERLPTIANLHIPSMSFSSLSSSELDTVSTASFFQDHSVSLGRLIGIRPADKTWLCFPTATDGSESVSVNAGGLDVSKTNGDEISGRICIPIVIGIVLKMIRNWRNSRS